MSKHGAKWSPDGQIGLVYEVQGRGKRSTHIDERGDINILLMGTQKVFRF
jgi:hypothetical protein